LAAIVSSPGGNVVSGYEHVAQDSCGSCVTSIAGPRRCATALEMTVQRSGRRSQPPRAAAVKTRGRERRGTVGTIIPRRAQGTCCGSVASRLVGVVGSATEEMCIQRIPHYVEMATRRGRWPSDEPRPALT
jgi:hypothetical protein